MTYDYKCNDCDNQFVIEKGINEVIEIKCPKCGSKDVKRVFGVVNSIWKCDGAFGKSK